MGIEANQVSNNANYQIDTRGYSTRRPYQSRLDLFKELSEATVKNSIAKKDRGTVEPQDRILSMYVQGAEWSHFSAGPICRSSPTPFTANAFEAALDRITGMIAVQEREWNRQRSCSDSLQRRPKPFSKLYLLTDVTGLDNPSLAQLGEKGDFSRTPIAQQ